MIIELESQLELARLAEGFLENPAIEFVEAIGIDQVIALTSRLAFQILVAQAQQLDEIESVENRLDFLVANRQALGDQPVYLADTFGELGLWYRLSRSPRSFQPAHRGISKW